MVREKRRDHERAHIREMRGYTPGARPVGNAIKLNTNENPFPPSPKVMAALAAVVPGTLQRYPDPFADSFRKAVARLHDVNTEQVIATNGGDELLRLAITTFVDPGRAVGIVSPSYGIYSVLSAIQQAPLSRSPLRSDWSLTDATAALWNSEHAQLGILTNPHAPSGTLFPLEAVERLAIEFEGILLIDEAYVDFVDPASSYDTTQLVRRYPNVLLMRTLSKGYSLAGLRLAYCIGDAGLVKPMLAKTKDSYNVDGVSQLLGVAALEDRSYASRSWEHVRRERERLSTELQDLGFSVLPSQTNFLLASIPESSNWSGAQDLQIQLEGHGVYVRWFDEDRLRKRLRISIGTTDENNALVSALRSFQKPASADRSIMEGNPGTQ